MAQFHVNSLSRITTKPIRWARLDALSAEWQLVTTI